MHRTRPLLLAVATAVPLLALPLAPAAQAYPNCDAAIAAGAAPIYAGQPGYSKKLDRDGDGVACDSGSGGGAPAARAPYVPVPNSPAAPYIPPQDAPPTGPAAGGDILETVVDWTGTDCIDITAPDASGTPVTANYCGGSQLFQATAASPQSPVGADPVMGNAATLSCEIRVNRLRDSGVAGDGHDIKCLTTAGALG